MVSADVQVAVLAGGLGTRIRGILGDTPKVLAPINGRPFLDIMLADFARLGIRQVLLCLGHLADKVIAHLAGATLPDGMIVDYVVEAEPLGTAGAIRLAGPKLTGDPVMIINGDTWMNADWAAFITSHQTRGSDVSLLCVQIDDISRFGRVDVTNDGQIIQFVEKDPTLNGRGLINGGVYLMSRRGLAELCNSQGPSLERDFLQPYALRANMHGYVARGASFIDIGTPESLSIAGSLILSS